MKLEIELVPQTVWFSSIYQFFRRNNRLAEWYKIKNELFGREGRQCYICGSKKGPFQAHEFWEYDDENHIQRLMAIHHLCDLCHKIKHIGFWCHTSDGRRKLKELGLTRKDLVNHFCEVNNYSESDFEKHLDEAFEIWRKRSRHKWKQDFGEYEKALKEK